MWTIFHFGDEWMCEWHSHKFSPTKRSRLYSSYHFIYAHSTRLHWNQMQTIFRHAQPHSVIFMAQQVPFYFRENEKHSEKPKHCVRKRPHTHTRMHWNWIQTNSILVILCLDGEEHSINGIAISVKMVADWSTIFFPLYCWFSVNVVSKHMFALIFNNVFFTILL